MERLDLSPNRARPTVDRVPILGTASIVTNVLTGRPMTRESGEGDRQGVTQGEVDFTLRDNNYIAGIDPDNTLSSAANSLTGVTTSAVSGDTVSVVQGVSAIAGMAGQIRRTGSNDFSDAGMADKLSGVQGMNVDRASLGDVERGITVVVDPAALQASGVGGRS
jgi:hypothetical protein